MYDAFNYRKIGSYVFILFFDYKTTCYSWFGWYLTRTT